MYYQRKTKLKSTICQKAYIHRSIKLDSKKNLLLSKQLVLASGYMKAVSLSPRSKKKLMKPRGPTDMGRSVDHKNTAYMQIR